MIWVYFDDRIQGYVCEHLKDSKCKLGWEPKEKKQKDVFADDYEVSLEDMSAWYKSKEGDTVFMLCSSKCSGLMEDEEPQPAVIARDTGKVLTQGDQNVSEDWVRRLVLAELESSEKGLRGGPEKNSGQS